MISKDMWEKIKKLFPPGEGDTVVVDTIVCPKCFRYTTVWGVAVDDVPISRIMPYELGAQMLFEREVACGPNPKYYICELCWARLSERDISRGVWLAIMRKLRGRKRKWQKT